MTATERLPIRAYLYDLGRNQRPSMDQWRFVIDALAEFDFNMMVINLEWRFHFRSAPGIAGPGDLTPDMARQLFEYGKSRGVEVVAQPNLIGHCEGIGATERYAHLSANPYEQQSLGGYEQINLELPEARTLVAAMLKDVLDAFPGRYIHIGLDEVRQMEHIHPDDPEAQLRSRKEMMLWLIDQARASGRTVMMWADMLVKQPELMDAIDRDVMMCEWNYGPERSIERSKALRDAGFRVLNCPSNSSYSGFGPRGAWPFANITHMVQDAAKLGIDGFLLTHWEMGIGSAFDFVWPWLAYTRDVVRGCAADDADKHLINFANERYGGGGEAYAALHRMLSLDFQAAIDMPNGQKIGHSLRYTLFRGAPKGIQPAHRENRPKRGSTPIWEPSPALIWWQLRPRLDQSVRDAMAKLRQQVRDAAEQLQQQVTRKQEEIQPLLGIARAYEVLVDHTDILTEAHAAYHAAAEAQPDHPDQCRQHLKRTADVLEKLRPGLSQLREHVAYIDQRQGLDPSELHWFEVQEKSLAEHIDALRGDTLGREPLLEFGEFMKRPADVTVRIIWR